MHRDHSGRLLVVLQARARGSNSHHAPIKAARVLALFYRKDIPGNGDFITQVLAAYSVISFSFIITL
jgi:hypothetical protein